MKVELRLGGLITVDGKAVPLGKTHALLESVGRSRSVRGAAESLGLSYRATWGRIAALEGALGQAIAVKTKGHGTVLTPYGEALRDALQAALDAFAPIIAAEERRLEERLARLGRQGRALRLAASHDPVLMAAIAGIPGIEAMTAGSRDAVERLLAGEADAAGFHLGDDTSAAEPPFDLVLAEAVLECRALFTREQGFLVAPGNPLALGTVADIARRDARFVNRQRGSGTRAWFDRLLAGAGLRPEDIVGYGVEEFTHQAVAAVVASGAADAGLGVRAEAERFGLGFVPIGRETYWIASRAGAPAAPLEALVAAVAERLPAAPGYEAP